MATKKYQIQQKVSPTEVVTLHPETDASIVLLDPSITDVGATTVAWAIEQHEGDLRSIDIKFQAQKTVNDAQADTNEDLYDKITALEGTVGGLSGAMQFLGKSSTPITDGDAEAPTINNVSVSTSTLKSGDVVLHDNKEFVWDGSKWELFGDEGSYVLKTRKINGQALTSDITLTGQDIYCENLAGEERTIEDQLTRLENKITDRQLKTDNSLPTTAKTVVGAIGEVKTTADGASTKATNNATAITNITNGTTTVGKASKANKWTTARTITVSVNSGVKKDSSTAISGSGDQIIDGSENKTISVTLGDSGVNADTYSAVTVNAKGIVTEGGYIIEVGSTNQATPSNSLAVNGIFFKEI